MRSLLKLLIVLCLVAPTRADDVLPAKVFTVPDGLEVTVWAKAPMFYNPTNIDIDQHGRVWVAEAVNYRTFKSGRENTLKHPNGDRIMVLEDSDGDGAADRSWVFVQDKDLVAPLGVAVFGNRVVVSCSPSIIVYTDTDGDAKFDPKVDKKDILLTGFGGKDHDHGLHSVVGGPDGRWYFNAGNAGPHIVKDKSGWTLRAGSFYNGGSPHAKGNTPGLVSDDGRVYVGGLAMSVKPDGTDLRVESHNFRNCYEIAVNSFGDIFGTDNDDQVASCRTTWLMRHGNAGYVSTDGARSWRADQRPGQSVPEAHWRQADPGVIPYGDLYGAGSPTGICVYENGALPEKYNGVVLACEAGRNVVFGYHVKPDGAGYRLERFSFMASTADNPDYKWAKREQDPRKWFRPSDVCVGADGCIYVADWFDPVVGGHQMDDKVGSGAIYRIKPKGKNPKTPKLDLTRPDKAVEALASPAANVRWIASEALQSGGAPELAKMTEDSNPFLAARALRMLKKQWTTYRPPDGKPEPFPIMLGRALKRLGVHHYEAPQLRTLLYQINDATGGQGLSPQMRRVLALNMRDIDFADAHSTLVSLAAHYDGSDRFYLEAWGIGCEGKEDALYPVLLAKLGAPTLEWSDRFADLVWRIHPEAAVTPVFERAMAGDKLSESQRRRAIDTLAFMTSKRAAEAMVTIATKGPDDLRSYAAWWVNNRRGSTWKEHGVKAPGPAKPQATPGVPGEAVYDSGVIRKGGVADIDVDLTGVKTLYLVVSDNGDGNGCEWADWAEPVLVNNAGATTKLTDLKWKSAESGWNEARVNRNAGGGPLRINGRDLTHGIGTHSPSVIVYDVSKLVAKGYTRLRARAGIDNGYDAAGKISGGADHPACGGKASVVFRVHHDGPAPQQRANTLAKVITSNADDAKKLDAAMTLASTAAGGRKLVELAADNKLDEKLREAVTEKLHANPDLGVRAMAGQYFPRKLATGATLPPLDKLAKIKGDAKRGGELFAGRAACHTCHTHGKVGRDVGPDLSAIATKFDRTAMLDAMINPSAAIVFGYEAEMITTKSGDAVTGFIVGSGDTLIVKDLAGQQHSVDTKDIASRKKLDVSIMPSVASLGLSDQDIADLAEFLTKAPQ